MTIDNYNLNNNLLIEAGAGTGKTFSIEHIVLRLLVEKQIPLKQMNIVTFTRKAASELKNRITDKINSFILEENKTEENIKKNYFCNTNSIKIDLDFLKNQIRSRDEATIGTIHSFCRKILLRYPDIAHISDNPDFVDETEFSREYLRNLYKSAVLSKLSYSEIDIYEDSNFKKNLQYEYRSIPYTEDKKEILNKQIIPISKSLNEKMIQNGKLLQMHLISLVHNHKKEIATRLFKDGYKILVVDEFQDTDVLQWEIFEAFAASGIRLIVVGDPKQSIYRFRGADINNYNSAKNSEYFKEGQVSLSENFRSTKQLGKFYNTLFSNWFSIPSADVIALENISYNPITFNKLAKSSDIGFIEAEVGSRDFHLLTSMLIIQNDYLTKGSVAFISSTNRELKEAGKIFTEHGIPWRFKNIQWSDSREVQEMIYLLDGILDPDEITKICLTRFWKHSPDTPNLLILEKETILSENWFSTLKKEADNRNWSQFFHCLSTETSLKKRLEEESDPEGIFFNFIEIWERMEEESIRRNFNLTELRNWMEEEQNDLNLTMKEEEDSNIPNVGRESDSVILMTIHGSKGLEYDTVFVPSWKPKERITNHKWELFHFKDKNDKYSKMSLGYTKDSYIKNQYLYEENLQQRRLYYVAYTRAKSNLFIGFSKSNPSFKKSILDYNNINSETVVYSIKNYEKTKFKKEPIQKKGINPSISLPIRQSYISRQFSKISFSSIKTPIEFLIPEIKIDEIPEEVDESLKDEFQELKQIRGMNFGTVVHSLFEKMDFSEINAFNNYNDFYDKSPNLKLFLSIINKLNEYRGLEISEKKKIESEIFKLLKETLENPIKLLNFSISQVENYLKEERFINLTNLKDTLNPKEYLVGAIDLIFEYNKLYYILDWKTNYLGSESSEIDANAKKKMKNEEGGENYIYQGELYMLALKNFLESRGVVNPENFIGGAIFYFVRHKHVEFVEPLSLNRYKELSQYKNFESTIGE